MTVLHTPDYTCIAPDMWLLYLQFALPFITKITLQPLNLCISKNFMVLLFTDHTNAYMQSILHLLLDNLPKLYVCFITRIIPKVVCTVIWHILRIVKCYRLVTMKLEVSSLSSNLKYKSCAFMHTKFYLQTIATKWQTMIHLPPHCGLISNKQGQFHYRQCQSITLQECSNTNITKLSCSAWQRTANMQCNKQKIATQFGIGHNGMQMIQISGHLYV